MENNKLSDVNPKSGSELIVVSIADSGEGK